MSSVSPFLYDLIKSEERNVRAEKENTIKVIKQLLTIKPHARKDSELEIIAKLLGNYRCFSQYSKIAAFPQFCKKLEYMSAAPNQIIYNQGDYSEYVYLVIRGKVSSKITTPNDEGGKTTTELTNYREGETFGEKDGPQTMRSVTTITKDFTELVYFRNSDLDEYIKVHVQPHFELMKLKDVVSQVKYVNQLPQKRQNEIAANSKFIKVHRGENIIQENDSVDFLYYLKSGLVKVHKILNFKIIRKTKEISEDPSPPSEEELLTGNFKTVKLDVHECLPGETLGDFYAINKKPSRFEYRAHTGCEILAIPIPIFKEIIREENVIIYSTMCLDFPDDLELREEYYKTYAWQRNKRKILIKTIEKEIRNPEKKAMLLEYYRGPKKPNPHLKPLAPSDHKPDGEGGESPDGAQSHRKLTRKSKSVSTAYAKLHKPPVAKLNFERILPREDEDTAPTTLRRPSIDLNMQNGLTPSLAKRRNLSVNTSRYDKSSTHRHKDDGPSIYARKDVWVDLLTNPEKKKSTFKDYLPHAQGMLSQRGGPPLLQPMLNGPLNMISNIRAKHRSATVIRERE